MKVFVIMRQIGEFDSEEYTIYKVVSEKQTAISIVAACDERVAAYTAARKAIPNANGCPLSPEATKQLQELAEQFSDLKDGIAKYSSYAPVVSLEYEEWEVE